MSRKRKHSFVAPRLIFGLILIFAGIVFTLEQMGYEVDAWDLLRDYWPVVLILAGLGKLLWPGSSGRFTGFLLAVLGVWFLAYNLYYTDLDPLDFWPLLLVLVGLRIVAQGLFRRRRADGGADSTVNAMAMLGGARHTSHSQEFQGGDMAAFMGGCEVDLRQARIADPPAVIDAFAFWGGVEILVPRDWHVVVRGIPILGGYEDKTEGPDDDEDDSLGPRQELIVKGFAIMGAVEVKNRRRD